MDPPVFELVNVSKAFGMTQALAGMSLELYASEVHAIVGENGAGKSTINKIMTGIYQPTSGEIRVDGKACTITGSHAARTAGIAAIYQEPMIFPDLDVAENIFISTGTGGPWLQPAQLHRQARELIGRIGISLDADRFASGLTLAEQQAVEIARALSQKVKVLIMDEPTASLSAHEAKQLHRIARTLAAEGVAIVYISHRLEEIFEIADRVTVIRDGNHVSTRPVAEATPNSMIAEMVGREVDNYLTKAPTTATSETLLEVRGLTQTGVFEDINFTLHRGEVLCLAGLVGARRTDVALALFGVTAATSGQIRYQGREFLPTNPRQAMDAGIAYVSEDRRKLGLAMPMNVSANISLATLTEFLTPAGLLRTDKEREMAETFRDRLNIRTPDVEEQVDKLSGGNQQKVMLAKWLNMQPELLIFDEPTRGIDIGAKFEVHELIRDFAAAGGGVLVISSDLPEVLTMGDRIVVMREGRQMGIVTAAAASQEKIMALATGQEQMQGSVS